MERLLKCIYSLCSLRIKNRVDEKGLSYEMIYPADPKQISYIVNNKRTEKNAYLVRKGVLRSNYYGEIIGLIPKLGFENEREVLWGTDEEINDKLYYYFLSMIEYLFSKKNLVDYDVELTIKDYVAYSKNAALKNLIESESYENCIKYYGVYKAVIESEYINTREKAIDFLWFKCIADFKKLFYKFTYETTFSKLDNKMHNFIINDFANMLKNYIPEDMSKGVIVEDMIIQQLSTSKKLLTDAEYAKSIEGQYNKMMNYASSKYITDIEEIQNLMYNAMEDKASKEF